ncbi:MAG: hypothetical protein ACYTXT_29025 [Nostoc sp.]
MGFKTPAIECMRLMLRLLDVDVAFHAVRFSCGDSPKFCKAESQYGIIVEPRSAE